MQPPLLTQLRSRTGHFALESGNHGDLWLDLDTLFSDRAKSVPLALSLVEQLALGTYRLEAIVGPALGGAILAGHIADQLGIVSCAARRTAGPGSAVSYRIDESPGQPLKGKRVGIVDDVIGAGSAVKATLKELVRLGAFPVIIVALLESGLEPGELASLTGCPVRSLGRLESHLWTPSDCPLCRAQVPLEVLSPMP